MENMNNKTNIDPVRVMALIASTLSIMNSLKGMGFFSMLQHAVHLL